MTGSPPSGLILIVDDTPTNISVVSGILRPQYRTKVATSGERALALCAMAEKPDLVLLDVMMPEMDGYEVCRRLKADPATAAIPVIFLTAKTEPDDEARGFDAGGVDYIHKPFNPAVIRMRVQTHIALKNAQDRLRDRNADLELKVRERTRDLSALQDVAIFALAFVAEIRDPETGNHIRRTQHYVKLLAERLRSHPRFSDELDEACITMLFKSAPLHDVGKVGIPDRILLKPGPLTGEEFAVMKTHAALGHAAIEQAERALGEPVAFLSMVKQITRSHHERWDGSGYPDGLSGERIPLSARLMALADVYDALVSHRVYKKGLPHDEAVRIIVESRERHFDPAIVDAFIAMESEFLSVAARYADADRDSGKSGVISKVEGR